MINVHELPISWTKTCQAMEEILSSHSDKIPEDMLKKLWPGYEPIWTGGEDLLWVKFIHHNSTAQTYVWTFDTDYQPVPWAAFPALLHAARDSIEKKCEKKFGSKSSEYLALDGEINASVPYGLHWGDWGEDDDLDVHCCCRGEWIKTMTFQNSVLHDILTTYEGYEEFSFTAYIGKYIDGEVTVTPMYSSNSAETQADVLEREAKKLMEEGYKPLIFQAADEDEKGAAIYWMTKDGGEKK